jgi:hypothetical protein
MSIWSLLKRNWGRYGIFAVSLAILFLLRGLVLLCVYPPLEGCDEHKHVGYLAFLSASNAIPVYRQSFVPPEIYPALRTVPHSRYGAKELTAIVGMDYEQYWAAFPDTPYETESTLIPVKAAFHPPGYYYAMSIPYKEGSKSLGMVGTVYLLRVINLGFAACALVFFLLALRPFFEHTRMGVLAALAVSCNPMFLVYVSRVSNAAASMLFISIVFFVLSKVPHSRRVILLCGFLGVCLGCGIWVRVDIVPFACVALLFLLWLAISRQVPRRSVILGSLVILALVFLISWPLSAWNLSHYGTLFPNQEMFRTPVGSTVHWNLSLLYRLTVDVLLQRFLLQNLWTSGWSFLHLPVLFYSVYCCILGIGLVGLVLLPFRKRLPPDIANLALLCMLAFGLVYAGGVMHALLSIKANAGVISTPSYYAMPAYLPFLGLVFYALRSLWGWLRWLVLGTCTVLFLFAEWYGTFAVGVPYWSQADSMSEALDRLQTIHPAFPSPSWLPLLVVLAMGMGGLVVYLMWIEQKTSNVERD